MKSDRPTTEFLGMRKGKNQFAFKCSHCGTTGEIELPPNHQNILRHDCGAPFVWIQRPSSGMFGKPRLEEVYVQSKRGARA